MIASDTQNQRVGKLVTAQPRLARVFEKHAIDYCCKGNNTLQDACDEQGVDLQQVLDEIDCTLSSPEQRDVVDWSQKTLSELVEHIVQTHHALLRSELPRITELIQKVTNAHGQRHPELFDIKGVFQEMRSELESHMMKEENILFPAISAMELSTPASSFCFGSVANPIVMMEDEHEAAGDALRSLRTLTGNYTPPADACPTYRVLMEALASLETDLHLHIHKENNILFPAAKVLEEKVTAI